MKINLIEQLNRMKYLLHAERGQVLSESEILKTYLGEQSRTTMTTDPQPGIAPKQFGKLYKFTVYADGMVGGDSITVYGNPTTKQIFADPNGTVEIGFKSLEDFVENWVLSPNDEVSYFYETEDYNPLYLNGVKTIFASGRVEDFNDTEEDYLGPGGQSGSEHIAQKFSLIGGSSCNVWGFAWINLPGTPPEDSELLIPALVGFEAKKRTPKNPNKPSRVIRKGNVFCLPSYKQYRIESTVTTTTTNREKTTTTTSTDKVVPRKYKLDLQDAFYFDCPGMRGCGRAGGSNVDPLTNPNQYKEIDIFATKLNRHYKDSAPIYVVGYASVEGNAAHNLQLSQNRADFVADAIRKKITNKNIKIIPIGKGATSDFDSKNLPPNRRVVVVLDENSIIPYEFTYYE